MLISCMLSTINLILYYSSNDRSVKEVCNGGVAPARKSGENRYSFSIPLWFALSHHAFFMITMISRKITKFGHSKSIFYVKKSRNLSNFFFIEEYQFRSTFFVIHIFDNFNFSSTLFSKMMVIFWLNLLKCT